jgi:NADH-quinone oxidoreductase subunit G
MYSADRLLAPMVRENGAWREVDWQVALATAAEELRAAGADQTGGLISPSATAEELLLFGKLLRGIGSSNIDHRLRQADFSDQNAAPVYPTLGLPIEALEKQDAVLVIGGHPRKEQPLLNHRLRKAALRGARILYINPVAVDFNHPVAVSIAGGPDALVQDTAAVVKALLATRGGAGALSGLLGGLEYGEKHLKMADVFGSASKCAVLLGNTALSSPHASVIRFLAGTIAKTLNAAFGTLGDGANAAAAALCGALPHREPGGKPATGAGKHALAMWQSKLPAYLLFNVEPDADCSEPGLAVEALRAAQCVVALTAFRTPLLDNHAQVLLPIALHGENEGSYLNVEGRLQSAQAAVPPPGEAKPGWKVLRVLAEKLGVTSLGYDTIDAITAEVAALLSATTAGNLDRWNAPGSLPKSNGALQRVTMVPMNAGDALVRRAPALQEGVDRADGRLHLNAATAAKCGLNAGALASTRQRNGSVTLPVALDESVPDGCVLLHGGNPALAPLGGWFGEISVTKA